MTFNPDYSPITEASSRRAKAMTGLGGVIGNVGGQLSEKRKLGAHQALAKKALAGDKEAQDELSIVAPEINKQVMEQLGAKTEQQQKGLIYDFAEALSLHEAGNPEAALTYLNQRVSTVSARGGDAQHTQRVRDLYAQDPEQGSKVMSQALLRMMDPDAFAKSLVPKEQDGKDAPQHQKTAAFLVRNKDTGEPEIAVGSFNPADGSLTTQTAKFENAEVLSKLGETAEESTERKVGEKRDIKRREGEEARASNLIERGTMAAESSATLRRGLELLESVETGGVDAISLATKKMLGIEGADEGELSRSLGKAVLAQLRETFGAQFTEREGQRLNRLEAGFGKSVANNKRILQQTLKIVERTARRAIASAKKRGDEETANDIEELLAFSLSTDAKEEAPADVKNMSDEELMNIARGGK